MPFTTSARTLFYNKKLFTAAGISSPPQTWDDVKADCREDQGAGQGRVRHAAGLGGGAGEALLWFLGNGGGYQNDAGDWTINSPQNAEALKFMGQHGLRRRHRAQPGPRRTGPTCGSSSRRADIGMIKVRRRLIPIIQDGKKLQASDWASVADRGQDRSAGQDAGRLRQRLGVQGRRQEAGRDQEVPRLHVPGQVPRSSSTRSTTCCRRRTRDPVAVLGRHVRTVPQGAAELGAVPSAPIWSTVKTQIQQQLGLATSQDPQKILDNIQQTAKKGS